MLGLSLVVSLRQLVYLIVLTYSFACYACVMELVIFILTHCSLTITKQNLNNALV
jgi:hypothetical protein